MKVQLDRHMQQNVQINKYINIVTFDLFVTNFFLYWWSYSITQQDANNEDTVFVLTDYAANQQVSSLVNECIDI
jgi:hypothetical protein